MNFHRQRDVVNSFYKLQGCRIDVDGCELDLDLASEFTCSCRPYIISYKLDYEPAKAPIIPWQQCVEDCKESSLRSPREQLSSYLDETNPAYPEAHDRGDVRGRFSRWAYNRTCPGIEDHHVSDLSMTTNVWGNSFDRMNQEANCIQSSVQGVVQDQAKVIEHSKIYESNFPPLTEKICKIVIMSCQMTFVSPQSCWSWCSIFNPWNVLSENWSSSTVHKVISAWEDFVHEIYNIYGEVESVISSLTGNLSFQKLGTNFFSIRGVMQDKTEGCVQIFWKLEYFDITDLLFFYYFHSYVFNHILRWPK